jgi:hypothetical protein
MLRILSTGRENTNFFASFPFCSGCKSLCSWYSKSKLINGFLCEQYHDAFFNQSVPLGRTVRRISNGLVETTFLIGSTSERGIKCQNVTMVFNLRGNATLHEKQRDILSGISSGIVIVTTCEEVQGGQMLEYVQNLSTHIKVVIALDHWGSPLCVYKY